jgi:hypothetical protein
MVFEFTEESDDSFVKQQQQGNKIMNDKRAYISEAFVPQTFGYTEEIISEDANGPIKALIIEGEMQRAETPNRNRRIYSETLLARETHKLQNFIRERNGLPCGLDHPIPTSDETASMQYIQRIGMENACALCTQLEMNNKVVYGKTRVLEGDHGTGDKLAALVRAKFKPGISSRGIGGKPSYQNNEGFIYVPEDFEMICYDFVTNPSTHNAILTQRINEELEFFEHISKQHVKTLWSVLTDIKGKY